MTHTRVFASTCLVGFLLAANAHAQVAAPQPMRQRGLTGIILSSTDDSFIVVDSGGNQTTIKLTPATAFEINRSVASLTQTIKRGTRVRISVSADGITQTVSSFGQAGPLTEPQVKSFLGVSDAEWAELAPRIEKIQALQIQSADPVLAVNAGLGNRFANAASSAPQEAEVALRTVYFVPDSSAPDLAESVKAFRAAKAQARADLASARKDLQDIVTPRQEALLVIVGILE